MVRIGDTETAARIRQLLILPLEINHNSLENILRKVDMQHYGDRSISSSQILFLRSFHH